MAELPKTAAEWAFWILSVIVIGLFGSAVVGGCVTAVVAIWQEGRKENLPVETYPAHPNTQGNTIAPYYNPATKPRLIREAHFYELRPQSEPWAGAPVVTKTIRFERKNFNPQTRIWSTYVDQFQLTPNEAGQIEPYLVDRSRANSKVFGNFVLVDVNGEKIPFGEMVITIHAN